LFCQRACISFEIEVCFALTVFSDDFVETAIMGNFQKMGDEFLNITEGAEALTNSPLLALLPGPVIRCDVECIWGEAVSNLKHGLLRHHSVDSNFPYWEGRLT
jgi:hypothetical protein